MMNGLNETKLFNDRFSGRDDIYVNPELFTKKYRLFCYIFCTSFLCCLLSGFYLFHCYTHSQSGAVYLLTKGDSTRSIPVIAVFELLPFLLILFSGMTRHGFGVSLILLSVKGILSGFTLYSFAFDGRIRFTAPFGIFAVYTVLYSVAFLFTAAGAASVSRVLYQGERPLDRGRRSYVAGRYFYVVFPYLLLFIFTAVLDSINLGF